MITQSSRRILILGGYGVFGGRLAELLANESRLTLIIAGRSQQKADAFCAGVSGRAQMIAAAFDTNGDVAAQMRALSPDIIVDATGPFQIYGSNPYRIVKVAISLGVNYLDLADGADFGQGIAQFNDQAKERGVYILSGVSSFPVLSAAVVRHLAAGLDRVDTITGGIAPSPYAGVGLNVIKAIASYAGKPVKLTRRGAPSVGYGLTETMRFTVSPPGHLPLHTIRFSLVDVPDLQVLPPQWPGLKSIWMGAGPVPEVLHRALNALAWLVRLQLLPSLSFLAPLFFRVINTLRWGEHRGGMFVAITGQRADGLLTARSWHLLAEGADGPYIPSMAIESIVRGALDGRPIAPGARSAVRELELSDYKAIFANRSIVMGVREVTADTVKAPLYRQALGDAFDTLPIAVQRLHCSNGAFCGVASVDRGRGLMAQAIGWVFGFPVAGQDVAVSVTFRNEGQSEVWQRRFGKKSFSSSQAVGRGRFDGLVTERFGPLLFGLALVVDKDRLNFIIRRWTAFGVPLPLALAPTGDTYETSENGKFRFHVELKMPVVGLIARYQGTLEAREEVLAA